MAAVKLIVIHIAILLTVQSFAQTIDSPKIVSMDFNGQPLSDVLGEIQSRTGVSFVYNDKLIDGIKVTCRFEGGPVENAIKRILNEFDISYKVFPKDSYVLFKEKRPAPKHFMAVIVKEDPPIRYEDGILIGPKLITKNNLVYPAEAIKLNIEGNVKLNLFVAKDGSVCKTLLEQSSGSAILDSAAVEYAYKLKFIPAQVEDQPRNIWVGMLFKYFLQRDQGH